MYEYRQVIARLRLGGTDREVARAQHIGRAKVAEICHTFGLDIDKDVVRRVPVKHYRPENSGCDGLLGRESGGSITPRSKWLHMPAN